MVSWHGQILKSFEHLWLNIRIFAYRNRTIFEAGFILLYALEQAFLVWYTFNAVSFDELGYVVSLFAIIVLTTFALHKLLMESRINVLEDEVKGLQQKKDLLEMQIKSFAQTYDELLEMSQDLYTFGHSRNRKRGRDEK